MNEHSEGSACPEWDPVGACEDERSAYDDLRGRCPVARSRLVGWSVLRHADVLDVLHDHATYRNHGRNTCPSRTVWTRSSTRRIAG